MVLGFVVLLLGETVRVLGDGGALVVGAGGDGCDV